MKLYLYANLLYKFLILIFRCTTHISSLKITWPIVLSRPGFFYVTYAMAEFYYCWRLSRPSEFNKCGSNRVTKVLTCSEQHSRSGDVRICNGTVQEPSCISGNKIYTKIHKVHTGKSTVFEVVQSINGFYYSFSKNIN